MKVQARRRAAAALARVQDMLDGTHADRSASGAAGDDLDEYLEQLDGEAGGGQGVPDDAELAEYLGDLDVEDEEVAADSDASAKTA